MRRIETVEELNGLYGQPVEASIIKVTPRLTPEYRRMLEASPFVALATVGRVVTPARWSMSMMTRRC